jgi:hypothetical protein
MNTSNVRNPDRWEERFNLYAEILRKNEIVKDIIKKRNDTGNKHPIQYPPYLRIPPFLFDRQIWNYRLVFGTVPPPVAYNKKWREWDLLSMRNTRQGEPTAKGL